MAIRDWSLACAFLVVAAGGCATSRTQVYDTSFPGPRSHYTEAGTAREQVIAHLGNPTSVSRRPDGREVLHYGVTGTLSTTYLLLGEKERATAEDLDLVLRDGAVVSGSWHDSEGNKLHW